MEGEELGLAHDCVEDNEDGNELDPTQLEHVPHLGLEDILLLCHENAPERSSANVKREMCV